MFSFGWFCLFPCAGLCSAPVPIGIRKAAEWCAWACGAERGDSGHFAPVHHCTLLNPHHLIPGGWCSPRLYSSPQHQSSTCSQNGARSLHSPPRAVVAPITLSHTPVWFLLSIPLAAHSNHADLLSVTHTHSSSPSQHLHFQQEMVTPISGFSEKIPASEI